MTSALTEIEILIKPRWHKKTGLIVAISDDLPGLLVHARTLDELEEQLPGAIREFRPGLGWWLFLE